MKHTKLRDLMNNQSKQWLDNWFSLAILAKCMLCSNKCARILFVHIYLDCRKVSYLWHGLIVPDVNSMQSVNLYFGGQDEQIYITRLFIGVRIKKTCEKSRNETTEDSRLCYATFSGSGFKLQWGLPRGWNNKQWCHGSENRLQQSSPRTLETNRNWQKEHDSL